MDPHLERAHGSAERFCDFFKQKNNSDRHNSLIDNTDRARFITDINWYDS